MNPKPRHRAPGAGLILAALIGLGGCASEPLSQASPSRGAFLARRVCAQCHAVGGQPFSPVQGAPRFGDFGRLHPGQTLDEILARGLISPHRPMPTFSASSQNIADLAAYVSGVN